MHDSRDTRTAIRAESTDRDDQPNFDSERRDSTVMSETLDGEIVEETDDYVHVRFRDPDDETAERQAEEIVEKTES